MDSDDSQAVEANEAVRWQAVGPIKRRVLGVLVEKAKTTPAAYPLTVNAIRTGANQKSNRDPQMDLAEEHVQDALDQLRELRCIVEVQGAGRVPKYRHALYEWLGVTKVELAVIAELLLRGAQTVGELRSRASRMEPIADLGALAPLLDSLQAKGLVIALTPAGRGQVVSHNLYKPAELERVRAQVGSGGGSPSQPPSFRPATLPMTQPNGSRADDERPRTDAAGDGMQPQLAELRRELTELRNEFDALARDFEARNHDIDRLREALGP